MSTNHISMNPVDWRYQHQRMEQAVRFTASLLDAISTGTVKLTLDEQMVNLFTHTYSPEMVLSLIYAEVQQALGRDGPYSISPTWVK